MFTESPILRWRKYKQNYTLQGNKCIACSENYYPKSYLCKCGSTKFESITFEGIGTLVSFTQITIPPTIYSKNAPYCIGIVKLEEGPQIITQITDAHLEDLKIGMKMQMCFRKYYSSCNKSIINYGIKFSPTLSE